MIERRKKDEAERPSQKRQRRESRAPTEAGRTPCLARAPVPLDSSFRVSGTPESAVSHHQPPRPRATTGHRTAVSFHVGNKHHPPRHARGQIILPSAAPANPLPLHFDHCPPVPIAFRRLPSSSASPRRFPRDDQPFRPFLLQLSLSLQSSSKWPESAPRCMFLSRAVCPGARPCVVRRKARRRLAQTKQHG